MNPLALTILKYVGAVAVVVGAGTLFYNHAYDNGITAERRIWEAKVAGAQLDQAKQVVVATNNERSIEQARVAVTEETGKNAQAKQAVVAGDLLTVDAAVAGLRTRLPGTDLTGPAGTVCSDPAPVQRVSAPSKALVVYADLLERSIARNKLLAADADANRIGWEACYSDYQGVRAAGH